MSHFTLTSCFFYASFTDQIQVPETLLHSPRLSGRSLNDFVLIFLSRPLSHHHFCSLTSCLCVYFSADVLTDRVIALEADGCTQADIARHYELMLKLGRISGISPYMSHLVYRVEGNCVYGLNIGANSLCILDCVCVCVSLGLCVCLCACMNGHAQMLSMFLL